MWIYNFLHRIKMWIVTLATIVSWKEVVTYQNTYYGNLYFLIKNLQYI